MALALLVDKLFDIMSDIHHIGECELTEEENQYLAVTYPMGLPGDLEMDALMGAFRHLVRSQMIADKRIQLQNLLDKRNRLIRMFTQWADAPMIINNVVNYNPLIAIEHTLQRLNLNPPVTRVICLNGIITPAMTHLMSEAQVIFDLQTHFLNFAFRALRNSLGRTNIIQHFLMGPHPPLIGFFYPEDEFLAGNLNLNL